MSNQVKHRLIRDAKTRLGRLTGKIEDLLEDVFPQPAAKRALQDILKELQSFDVRGVGTAQSSEMGDASVEEFCLNVSSLVKKNHNRLGFLVRSTNSRNAFEAYRPLGRLAENIFKSNVAVVISSEWDCMPFIQHPDGSLEGFAFVGLPATEAGNPLILPLAGHEFGHRAWRMIKEKNLGVFQEALNKVDQSVGANSKITRANPRALIEKHVEEAFCDLMGVRLFGQSYCYAFSYLLALGDEACPAVYPTLEARAQLMAKSAAYWKMDVDPALFDPETFKASSALTSDETAFRDCSRQVLDALATKLIKLCDALCQGPSLLPPNMDQARRIYGRFKLAAPADDAQSLADIVLAGWLAHADSELFAEDKSFADRQPDVLNALVLKTIEIFEIETALAEAKAA